MLAASRGGAGDDGDRAICRRSAAPLLRVEGLTKHFDVSPPWLNRVLERRPRHRAAVDGVSFEIAQGETFSLVGESGCGKSTVARLVVGLYPPTAARSGSTASR